MNTRQQTTNAFTGERIRRFLIHAAFWLFFTVLFFVSPPKPFTFSLLISWLSILTVVMLVVYLNFYLLIPNLYFQKKYLFYFVSLALLIVGGAFLIKAISLLDFVILRMPFTDNLKNLFFFVVMSGAFKLYRDHGRKKRMLDTLEKHNLQMELSFLKSQVNPHFLFNTLNNIYAANLENSDTANDMLLKLADILRFQLEAAKKDFVALEEEATLIEHYIGLEKLRTLNSHVEFIKEGDFKNFMMPPLLLLPLVENAFKYGKNRFRFRIALLEDMFVFEAENKMQSAKKNSIHPKKTGIGIENVKKRLDLVFRDNYSFDASPVGDSFKVSLKIDLT